MKILVIEYEKKIRNYIKSSLKSECFAVDAAKDCEKGLYLIQINEYDLITLDNALPQQSGAETCRAIRRAGKKMPILILSVNQESAIKVSLLNAGADDYLTKPFSIDEFLARIKALLRRPREIEEDIYQVDNLELNINKHIVKRNGAEIYLTRKEFSFLHYFMKNKDVLLSRGMIMEHVWDMSVDPFSNTIESHIRSLRRKIDQPGMKKLIHTIPCQGYKLFDN